MGDLNASGIHKGIKEDAMDVTPAREVFKVDSIWSWQESNNK